MSSNDFSPELLEIYSQTIVEIVLDEKVISHQELFEIWKCDFYMITAANPYSQLLTEEENQVRNRALREELDAFSNLILPGLGRDPSSAWNEPGWVLVATNESELIALAKKYQQNAIFRFSEKGKQVVSCL